MRYIVKVECLSAEVLAELKKSSRIIHIFSLIDNTIALETEDIGHIKGLKEVRQVYESGKAKLMLTGALNKIGIFDVQNQNVYGDGVWIGVIDSGIGMADPLVSGAVISERDFTEEGSYDPIGHGTTIARILKTVAPNVSLINAKVIDRTGEADEVNIMRAIEWCANSGVEVMNLSLGIPIKCDGACPLCELVDAASKKTIIVAAVGNDGPEEDNISCPANSISCIGVGSIEEDDTVADYSSRGTPSKLKPDIIAPGCIRYGNFKLEGTSIAAPFVSASAALLLSVYATDKKRVVDAILSTAEDKGFPRWVQGNGSIRTNKALEMIICG
jgi:subtilisin family serine protease